MKILSLFAIIICTALLVAASIDVVISQNRAPARIAFMGDSLTESWQYPTSNLGAYGQTTSQMLDRFPKQVLGHRYAMVEILGGTNDVLRGVPPEITIQNIARMVDLSEENGITPLVCTLPPLHPRTHDCQSTVVDLNAKIKELAIQHHLILVDYNDAPMLNGWWTIFFRCRDGIHWREPGYAVMEVIFLRASTRCLTVINEAVP